MEWNVYWWDPNAKEIRVQNVFNLSIKFQHELDELKRKKNEISEEHFSRELNFAAKYCFWSKCEHEIWVSDWMSDTKDGGKKIDVYDQLRLNWDDFADYVWRNL